MLKLLLPIDGSERSKQSVEWVKRRYKPNEIEIELLMVREDYESLRSSDQYDMAKAEVMPILNDIAKELEDFDVKTEVRLGRAGEEILSFAKDANVNTIVMTKSTKKGWVKMIGSVTTHVVKYADCVVVIVPEIPMKYE